MAVAIMVTNDCSSNGCVSPILQQPELTYPCGANEAEAIQEPADLSPEPKFRCPSCGQPMLFGCVVRPTGRYPGLHQLCSGFIQVVCTSKSMTKKGRPLSYNCESHSFFVINITCLFTHPRLNISTNSLLEEAEPISVWIRLVS